MWELHDIFKSHIYNGRKWWQIYGCLRYLYYNYEASVLLRCFCVDCIAEKKLVSKFSTIPVCQGSELFLFKQKTNFQKANTAKGLLNGYLVTSKRKIFTTHLSF